MAVSLGCTFLSCQLPHSLLSKNYCYRKCSGNAIVVSRRKKNAAVNIDENAAVSQSHTRIQTHFNPANDKSASTEQDEAEEDDDFSEESSEEGDEDEGDYSGFQDFEFDDSPQAEEEEDDDDEDGEYASEQEEDDEEYAPEFDQAAETARKIDELCAKVRENKDYMITRTDLLSLYSFRLDKFQRLAIEAFLKGSSAVVSAPTSSGKTLIAEAASAATLARGKRLFYTTPLKALSNQKFKEFRSIFGEGSVGLLTGDISFNRDAPIVIMTAEILRNKFYLSAGNEDTLGDVEVVVLDEIHYISDLTRGTVWEETVIYCPKRIQLICLSATIANPEELAGWIAKVHGATELITSNKRPVPLTWHISRRTEMLPLLNEKGTRINRKLLLSKKQLEEIYFNERYSVGKRMSEDQLQTLLRFQVPKISDTLKQMVERNMLPAIWFILSRKRCDEAVTYLQDANLLTNEEYQQVDEALKAFRENHPDAIREAAVQPLYHGVAAHHAGLLPLWKSFIEELFQKGLVKVVFATETLAAGINMPARSTVLSTHTGKGQKRLSANAVLQMAGRAGRRGIDIEGHVVVAQTPFRGPEECYKMFRAGSEPLVSQFTATYGMALNLLQEAASNGREGKSLTEARSLIEQSFGNYMGSEILVGARSKLVQLKAEIESLESGQSTTDSLTSLYEEKINEYNNLREKVEIKERAERGLKFKCERLRSSVMQNQLNELLTEQLPYVSISYVDMKTGQERTLPAMVVHKTNDNPFSQALTEKNEEKNDAPYIAYGCDNYFYRFSATVIKRVYKSNIYLEEQSDLKSHINDIKWEIIGEECVSRSQCSYTTSVCVPKKLTNEYEVPEELQAAEKLLSSQQRSLGKLSRKLAEFNQSEINNLVTKVKQMRVEKIARLKAKSERIANRIKQMQPSGWKEFLQVVKILETAGAMKSETHELLPLGEIARALRGTNELWLAMALQDDTLVSLRASELAAVAATLVTESLKSRSESTPSTIYEPSKVVMEWVDKMESKRQWLLELQEDRGVEFVCDLDPQVAGFVEAWASGVNWRELEIADIMDEGDFARLLRRTIDLLSQIPHLPHIDQTLSKTAKEAAKHMDRPPISEPVGG